MGGKWREKDDRGRELREDGCHSYTPRLVKAYINPGGLEVVSICICNGAESLDGLDVLWLHFCQPD